MSKIKALSMDTNYLTQRLQNAEKSIVFLQHEHTTTLANLHDELAKWQKKCSDLTFQLTLSGIADNSKSTDVQSNRRPTIEQLENEIDKYKNEIQILHKTLEEKEQIIKDYENRLAVNDQKHALELHAEYDKQKELRNELEQHSVLIEQLNSKLQNDDQQSNKRNRAQLGHMILPNKPTKLKVLDESQQQQQYQPSGGHISKRSTSLNNQASNSEQELSKILYIGRRPITPSHQTQLTSTRSTQSFDEQSLTKRQRQLLRHPPHIENAALNKATSSQSTLQLTPALPPIVSRKVPLKALVTITSQREDQA